MQKEILLFLLNISNPIFDFIANISSVLGEQNILILLLAIIMYAYDKNKGFAICSSLVISLFSMGALKAIFKAPRPFTVIDEINGKRLTTATGYSFPSGHTTGAAAMYSSISFAIKKRVVSIFCAIIIVLVGLSRLYLGVHWPIDVATGLILGILLSMIFYPIFEKLAQDPTKKFKASIYFASISLLISLSLSILLQFSKIDTVAFSDMMKTMSFSTGGFFGIAYETKKINFKVDGSITQKIVRIVILIAGMLILQLALSSIIPESIYYIGAFFRYTIIGLWLTAIFPKVFKKLFV
ncbi:MAG: phosphatase PAP2 family protein [Pleomorphochaeta sp.]